MSESVASEREELMTPSRYEALLRPLSTFPTIIITRVTVLAESMEP